MPSERAIVVHVLFSFVTTIAAHIAKITGYPRTTIRDIIKKIKSGEGIERRPGSGRKRKLGTDDMRCLTQLALKHPKWSGEELAKELSNRKDSSGNIRPKVCGRTVRNRLHEAGLKQWLPAKSPDLKPHHIQARLQWCLANRERDWSRVVFSDESYFLLHRLKVLEWGRVRPHHPIPKHQKGIMVWGGISTRGKTPLKVARGSINADRYQDILEECLIQEMDTLYPDGWVLQQDNASAHTARSTKDWMRERKIEVLPWPACSPDLNPIENLWGIKKRLLEKMSPDNVDSMLDKIHEIWDSVEHELLKSLIDSMPTRIEQCIARNGGLTDY